jgi:hypothetical protein
MVSLRELQQSFATALRDPGAACAVLPPANLAIYRNNARAAFLSALELTFPVLRRRVGDDYFRQLVTHYRVRSPSRSGDLHWAGQGFAEFLDDDLRGSEYAWLADLARLEWSRAECSVAAALPPLPATALARFAAPDFEHLVFGLQPSLRLLSSSYPVVTIWLANQSENAPPVDQSLGSEQGMTLARADGVEVARLAPDLFSYLSALAAGATLGEAVARAGLDGPRLTQVLGYAFGEELVTGVSLRGPAAPA